MRNGKHKSLSPVTPNQIKETQTSRSMTQLKTVHFPPEDHDLTSTRILKDPLNRPGSRRPFIRSHNKPLSTPTTPESIQEFNNARQKLKRQSYSKVFFGNSMDQGVEEEHMKWYGLGYDQSISYDHLRLSNSTPDSSDEEADSSVSQTAFAMAKERHGSKKRKRGSS